MEQFKKGYDCNNTTCCTTSEGQSPATANADVYCLLQPDEIEQPFQTVITVVSDLQSCASNWATRSKDGVGCLGVAVVGGWRGEGAGEFGLNRAVTN